LIAPERSLFFNNFALNRDLGVMPYGRLFNNTLDYAAGIFNGNRNGYLANADSKSFAAFVNWKPFANAEGSLLENLNIGGSVFSGYGNNVPQPQTLRTLVPTSGNQILGVPFLTFNNNVRERGERAFWDLHLAYFYKQLAVVAEWESGFQDYAIYPHLGFKTRVPVESYYVLAGFLLTGETRSGVGIVRPRHPFSLKPGSFGLGAWEIQGRFNQMNIGNQVFTSGLADPNNWTNTLSSVECGFNWHISQYLKFYFAWQRTLFGDPVLYAPGGLRQLNSDLFLARIQLFF
jgi:phosphate-selective porin OprO/OprP